ncbi:MAG: serine/threonine protein kinase [Gemmatimonadaceae bacterium]|nr:serine/threonine protein kinase [Gemmatimonadaceae bacterium]
MFAVLNAGRARVVDRVLGVPSPFADRYAVVRELGRGASAVVILARDLVHDREVALKVLSAEYASVLGSERFQREVRLDRRLQHPYVIPILDSGEWEGWLYLVMPVVEGSALRAHLTSLRQLPVDDAVRYAQEIADALQHAHDHGVIHRDVKPENILLSGGHACLADFGIARALVPATGDDITTTGVILGTPAYMSPEQAAGDALDGRTDQYALACVLFEMLAGIPPFVGPSSQSIMQQRLARPAPSVQDYRPAVRRGLALVIARALSMAPADRFPNMRAMAEALHAATSPSPYGIEAVAQTPVRRGPGVRRLAFGAAALISVGVATWLAWRPERARDLVPQGGAVALLGEPDGANAEAARFFVRGRAALDTGDLDSAAAAFSRSAAADPLFARADLWQAQVMQWNPTYRSSAEWMGPARRASRGRLSTRDSLHAVGLVALGDRRFPEACEAFGALVRADSQSFVGWFGLGECRRLDRAVERDRASPSGWRFRAELSEAIRAYAEALAIAPGEAMGPAFSRAQQVFLSSASRVRPGRAVMPDTGDFFAYPSLRNDTVAFVPFRSGAGASLDPATSQQELTGAWRAVGDQELAFVRQWIQRMPASPYARLALALALEDAAPLRVHDSTATDARSVLHEARARNPDARVALQLAAAEVRVLVKAGRWAEAGRLADSLVRQPPATDYGILAALAVLLGSERAASAFLRQGWREPARARDEHLTDVPDAVLDALAPLAAAVLTGACESAHLDSLEHNVTDRINTLVEPRQQAAVRAGIIDDLLVQSAPCTSGGSMRGVRGAASVSVTHRLAAAAGNGNRRAALAALHWIDAQRVATNRANISWDAVALEGWALAALGDSTHAAARLDSALRVLPYTTTLLTSHARLTGGLRRTLRLRSDLARLAGDSATHARWRDALRDLTGWP